ncbi:MAG: flavin reductase family protein [Candidatus Poseidoniaceae archaeon]|jgi:flavin reductase (DIM6/NTAB) family NADH-FMN oxidoreductase RutF|tara:strand:- start:2642 stop:3448 length:807 start_codon:yes stop_codon:yes gene_type:complete
MDEKAVIVEYLKKCNSYAEASIARKEERGEVEEIPSWRSYIEFNEHAIEELGNGKLDAWFTPAPTHSLKQATRLDAEALEHPIRAGWLSGLLSPRPLIIASTQDEAGNLNLAPYTSVMAVSTGPPLLIASFSCNREGRYRDTLHNLRSTQRAILHLMPANLETVSAVDETAAPLPSGESEWNMAGFTQHEDEPLLINEAVAALEVEFIEDRPLPEAVARLAVLRVTGLWTTETKIPAEGLNVLCQHGHDRLTPAPQQWGAKVEKHYNR